MARSDRHDVASDALVREVARQLAEAAPPALEWEDLHRSRTHADAPSQPGPAITRFGDSEIRSSAASPASHSQPKPGGSLASVAITHTK